MKKTMYFQVKGKYYRLTGRHLDRLTERELERYMTTGKLPSLWWMRGKKKN